MGRTRPRVVTKTPLRAGSSRSGGGSVRLRGVDDDELREFVRQVIRQEPRPVLGMHLVCTAATLPASPAVGLVVFVSDGSAGQKFRGWDGSAWVNLG